MEDTATSSKPANGALAQAKHSALANCPTATPEILDALLRHIEDGKTLRQFCIAHRVGRRTVYDWLDKDPTFREQVELARRIGEAAIEDEILAIADTPSDHPDDVRHRKLMIYAREKRLVWSNPDRYSQRKQIDQRIEQRVVLTDIEREVRIRELLDKATVRLPEVEVAVCDEDPAER